MGKPSKSDYNNIAKSPLERLKQSKRAKASIPISDFSGGYVISDYPGETEPYEKRKKGSNKRPHPIVVLLDTDGGEYVVLHDFNLRRGTFRGANIATISIDEIGHWDIDNLKKKGSEYDPNIGS